MFNFNEISHSDCLTLLIKLFDLCDSTGCYVIDKNQTVVHWNQQMENLSAIESKNALGKPCLNNLQIVEFDENKEQRITSFGIANHVIEVKQYTQVIHNTQGIFMGGIGLLKAIKEQAADNYLEKTFLGTHLNFHGLLSRAPNMRPIFQLIENAAATEVTVLVRGESGSGKELVAKAIHDLSTRNQHPFLAINCAALSSNLLESELFGHVRGAFTGAIKDHHGLFQRAEGGTLFLDEVAELPLDLQAKLLRVVQERNFIPVGGDQSFDFNVRIVAATHRSLRDEVKKGRFREDLMYRLRVVPIFIPPLRERREDIHLLLWHFIQQHNHHGVRAIENIDPPAMRVLIDYQWPGNIRELQNVVEYAFVVGQGTTLCTADLPPEFREAPSVILKSNAKKITLSADEEMEVIRQTLQQSQGRVSLAAEKLGMSRATFWRKRKLYGI